MSFFEQFPKTDFDRFDDGNIEKIVNFFRHVDLPEAYEDDLAAYQYYELKDGDRPDIVSQKIYGTPGFYWTIFIINEFLQGGFNEYFKSFYDLDRGLEQEYGQYGVLTFVPSLIASQVSVDGGIIPAKLVNNLNGLDLLTDKSLIIRRRLTDGTDIRNWPSAKISLWKNNMYQLIVEDFSDRAAFFSTAKYDAVVDGNNVYQYVLDIGGSTDENREFLRQFRAHQISLNQTPITDPKESFEQSRLDLEMVYFNSQHIFAEMIDSPEHYTSAVTQPGRLNAGDKISGFQALVEGQGTISAGNFKTHREVAYADNDARRQIKVVRPEFIRDFARKYKDLINLT